MQIIWTFIQIRVRLSKSQRDWYTLENTFPLNLTDPTLKAEVPLSFTLSASGSQPDCSTRRFVGCQAGTYVRASAIWDEAAGKFALAFYRRGSHVGDIERRGAHVIIRGRRFAAKKGGSVFLGVLQSLFLENNIARKKIAKFVASVFSAKNIGTYIRTQISLVQFLEALVWAHDFSGTDFANQLF